MHTIETAKNALDTLIRKSRVHFYKPIQIAEILHKYRTSKTYFINILDKNTYKNISKKWRDNVTKSLIGNVSTSSAMYQNNLFDENAIPPTILKTLSDENNKTHGAVEAYIYRSLNKRLKLLTSGVDYCLTHNKDNFHLEKFLEVFWQEAGLKRSIDKVYECIVYALIASLVNAIEVDITLSYNKEKKDIIQEFEDFSKAILNISVANAIFQTNGSVHRIGATNAADRGLDIWTNFGVIVQIKHLSLTEKEAEKICDSVNADRIVIVCKDSEKTIIESLLGQIGWRSRIQSIITKEDLIIWYERALRGKYAHIIGDDLLKILIKEIYNEFPTTEKESFIRFYNQRHYHLLPADTLWLKNGGDLLTEF